VNKKISANKATATKKRAATKKKVAAKPASTKKAVTKKAATPAKKPAAAKKAPVKKAATKPAPKTLQASIGPKERYEMIAKMAYYRAEKRNFAPGHEKQDWLECEQIIDRMIKNNDL